MKILVVGGGGREHALVWKIAQSPLVEKVYCAPGNPGMKELAETVHLAVDNIDGLCDFAIKEQIDLTVVGPELPLTLGIVDRFKAQGLAIFGPSKAAAQIEGSKGFSKDLMAKYGIKTAAYESFTDRDAAAAYIRQQGAPIVVKVDGLAAGKGVILAQTVDEAIAAVDDILVKKTFGDAGDAVVVEEFLTGEEASFFAFTDGKNILPLASSQDHKQIFDGDKGPNTGGMGAYSPAPVVTDALYQRIVDEVVQPTIDGMAAEGCPYCGILFVGLMIENDDFKVLEFNARFGDPECQPLLSRMKSDVVPVLLDCARGELTTKALEWYDRAAVCVVLAAGGYPASYSKGDVIEGIDAANAVDGVRVFHAGTAEQDGRIVTAGGRVLGVTGWGETVAVAIDKAYEGADKIQWNGMQMRRDIGQKALKR
ncbi:phosphoribosylamine--glycine ligase [Desulfuromonas acetoxidans]|uniref:Phosphoribosylamine--glycine ligase n=1 Tax=Desulfuromonas acetoxidans (strain DSM 684 / 11070) TaxID=281689 RepID=Q1JX84_DESA6|nr:phosphoribosylamine--glycine ligase [Desulfuromonas acetoxidans]EAT14908.1 phosphoribosylamine--glycine ligase [Desulfuromonas acetoxidans DSM 684]MBF0645565.1 phosphoribosylamine--glycine ligase [Desulfuromonas acetoxidans]NVD23367.1 phosphoribosylamine--glycine ligase [Desulfuromonas acetoxidans]NVE15392.1 phosphoribosylamine--glycine ligase [Desulfuromonas acetoxidans]